MRLLILGASGDQGAAQVQAALAAGHSVKAACRRPPVAEDTPSMAAPEWVPLDYSQPATLAPAMQGMEVVLANFPSSSFNDGPTLVRAAVATGAAAREAGVALIVFNTSLPVMETSRGFAAHDVRLQMREALEASGVPVISLQPVVFMDNLLRGWAFPHIADRDRFVYPHGPNLEVCWICQDDLAALMLAAAARPDLAGRHIAVGGPAPIRGADVAAALAQASGREIHFESQSVEAFCAAMEALMQSRAPEERSRMIRELGNIYRWYNTSAERPFFVDMAPVLRELPVRLTSFVEWSARQRWRRE
jgi:uncharacterized protein YbjT (DUF2867 family)